MRVVLLYLSVSAKAEIVFVPIPDHAVSEPQCLIASQRRSNVVKAAKIRERQIRNTPVEGVSGNAFDSEEALDILLEGVKVAACAAPSVVVQVQRVVHPSKRTNITERRIDAGCSRAAANRREWIVRHVIRGSGLQSEIDVTPASAPAASTTTSATAPAASTKSISAASTAALLLLWIREGVIEPHVKVIGVVRRRCDVMKVLNVARQVGRRNEREQTLSRRIDHGLRN